MHGNEQGARDDSISLIEFGSVVWQGKWVLIGTILLTVGLAWCYILTAASWYRVEVLLKPTDTRSNQGLSGQVGGALASLAGIDVNSSISAEPVAVLKSNEFTANFINEQHLLPILFPRKWDWSLNRWKSAQPADQPDIRDGVRYFSKKIRSVQEDRKTGLVTLSIEWTDPKMAASWANMMVDRVNEVMRQRSLNEAEYNVDYLEHALAASNVVTLQQSIGRVLESELQKLMLAKGNKEFAFRVLDHAQIPKYRTSPDRVLITTLAIIIGACASTLFVVSRQVFRRDRAARASRQSAVSQLPLPHVQSKESIVAK